MVVSIVAGVCSGRYLGLSLPTGVAGNNDLLSFLARFNAKVMRRVRWSPTESRGLEWQQWSIISIHCEHFTSISGPEETGGADYTYEGLAKCRRQLVRAIIRLPSILLTQPCG